MRLWRGSSREHLKQQRLKRGASNTSSSTHTHSYKSEWKSDETYHWHEANCGHEVVSEKEKHAFKDEVTAPTYEAGGYTTHTCTVCGYSYKDAETDKLTHNYSSEWSKDETSHWRVCTDEGYTDLKTDEGNHSYDEGVVTDATYDTRGYTTYTCTVCGYSYTGNETPSGKEKEQAAAGIIPSLTSSGTLTYGLYPQSRVSDTDLLEALGGLSAHESNGWYLYEGNYYASVTATPASVGSTPMFDDGSKVESGSKYWFKCELIEWKVLVKNANTYSLMSTCILDSHRYNAGDTDAGNYKNSEIRDWLNDSFLDTAFNLGSSHIQTITVDNSASTTSSDSNDRACENTEDKIYLLSYQDYVNADYGFATNGKDYSSTRYCKATDYARARGIIWNNKNNGGYYWTRSPSATDRYYSVETINYSGSIGENEPDRDDIGVRPGLTISYSL